MGKRPPPKGSFSKRGGAQPNFWQCCCSRAFGSFRAGPSSGLPDMHKYSESDTRPSCRTTPGGPLAYQGWPWFRLPWCVHTYTVRHKCRTTAVRPLATSGLALARAPWPCTHNQTQSDLWQLQGWLRPSPGMHTQSDNRRAVGSFKGGPVLAFPLRPYFACKALWQEVPNVQHCW